MIEVRIVNDIMVGVDRSNLTCQLPPAYFMEMNFIFIRYVLIYQ